MLMPEPQGALLRRKAEFVAALRTLAPGSGVIDEDARLSVYEPDGLTAYRQHPLAVVLPETTGQVSRILAYCHSVGLKVVPRGAGTSLSGGALPLADGIILGLGKFKKILDIDYANRRVVAQPGVTNLAISQAVAHKGFYYAPDPSSQIACSIGGNVAENSGGVHCLKYGMTTNNLLGVELVLMDGPAVEVEFVAAQVQRIGATHGACYARLSNTDEERLKFWAGRKAAFPAVGRISPDYCCMDGTIPRRELPRVLAKMQALSAHYGLRVANVFHAGDGNLHPLILYDANKPEELEAAERFGADILKLCVEVGGVLTGEHGVGVEKRDLMEVQFGTSDLEQQQGLKCAFDADGLLNPGKVFPTLSRCAELGRMRVHRGKTPFPELPRF